MAHPDSLRHARIALPHGSGSMPALGFGTPIPDPVATRNATKAALEAGFRLLDTAERYGTEREVGEAMRKAFQQGPLKREDVFVTTKLWNTNHRPERVKPALGHSSEPSLPSDPVVAGIARRVNKTPAQVLLAWAIQRGTAPLTTSKTPSRIQENFAVSAIPEDAVQQISEGIQSWVRFSAVVATGVPGFIPGGK